MIQKGLAVVARATAMALCHRAEIVVSRSRQARTLFTPTLDPFVARPLPRCRLTAFFFALALVGLAAAPSAGQSLVQSAKCGVFYDKWEVPGAPSGMLAMVGMAHEGFAARDCIAKNDISKACEHYRRTLAALGKMGPEDATEFGPDIKAKMAELECKDEKPQYPSR